MDRLRNNGKTLAWAGLWNACEPSVSLGRDCGIGAGLSLQSDFGKQGRSGTAPAPPLLCSPDYPDIYTLGHAPDCQPRLPSVVFPPPLPQE